MRLIFQSQSDYQKPDEHERENRQKGIESIFRLSDSTLPACDSKNDFVADDASGLKQESDTANRIAGNIALTHFPATDPMPNARYTTPMMTLRKEYGGLSKIWGITTVIPT